MAIRLTETRLRQIIREEARKITQSSPLTESYRLTGRQDAKGVIAELEDYGWSSSGYTSTKYVDEDDSGPEATVRIKFDGFDGFEWKATIGSGSNKSKREGNISAAGMSAGEIDRAVLDLVFSAEPATGGQVSGFERRLGPLVDKIASHYDPSNPRWLSDPTIDYSIQAVHDLSNMGGYEKRKKAVVAAFEAAGVPAKEVDEVLMYALWNSGKTRFNR